MTPVKSPQSSHGLFKFFENGQTGYLDAKGNVAIPAQFEKISDEAGDFFDGLARVRRNGRIAFIDATGKIAFTTNDDSTFWIDDFHEGRAQFAGPTLPTPHPENGALVSPTTSHQSPSRPPPTATSTSPAKSSANSPPGRTAPNSAL